MTESLFCTAAAESAPAPLTPQLPAKAARWSKAPQATVVPIISCAADKFRPPEGPFRRRLPGLSNRHPERLPHKSGIHPPGANIQTRCLSGCGWRYSCADRSDKPDRPVLFYPAVPDAPAAGPIHPPGANIQTRCLSGCGWRYSCADRSDKPDRPVLFYPAVPDAPAAGPPAD